MNYINDAAFPTTAAGKRGNMLQKQNGGEKKNVRKAELR